MAQHSAAATVVALLHIGMAAILLRGLDVLLADCGKQCVAPANEVKAERTRNAK